MMQPWASHHGRHPGLLSLLPQSFRVNLSTTYFIVDVTEFTLYKHFYHNMIVIP